LDGSEFFFSLSFCTKIQLAAIHLMPSGEAGM